jgi:hypothetical protein
MNNRVCSLRLRNPWLFSLDADEGESLKIIGAAEIC